MMGLGNRGPRLDHGLEKGRGLGGILVWYRGLGWGWGWRWRWGWNRWLLGRLANLLGRKLVDQVLAGWRLRTVLSRGFGRGTRGKYMGYQGRRPRGLMRGSLNVGGIKRSRFLENVWLGSIKGWLDTTGYSCYPRCYSNNRDYSGR
jgi:hypothetical protein